MCPAIKNVETLVRYSKVWREEQKRKRSLIKFMKNTKHRPDIMGSAFTSKNWNYDRGPRVFLFLSIEPGTTKYLPTPSNLNLSIKKKKCIYMKQSNFLPQILLDKTLNGFRGLRLDNRKVFIVPQDLGPNILRLFFCRSINYTIVLQIRLTQ